MASPPEAVVIADKPLACGRCGARTFFKRVVVMPGPAASAFGLSAVSPRASCYVCSACSFVHWFADEPK